MKYKMMMIDGQHITADYKKRVYIISQQQYELLCNTEIFVIRYTVDGQKLYRSADTDRHYLVS